LTHPRNFASTHTVELGCSNKIDFGNVHTGIGTGIIKAYIAVAYRAYVGYNYV